MKKVFVFIVWLCLSAGTAGAYSLYERLDTDSVRAAIKATGLYERKRVVHVDNALASDLYRRALSALSDWTGSDGPSSAGLDYCDKDEGVVTYKGAFFNGQRTILLDVAKLYTDFVLKVRCKDGRAQVTVTVPSVFVVSKSGRQQVGLREVILAQEKSKKRGKEPRGNDDTLSVYEVVDILLDRMDAALRTEDDDDF